MVDKTKWDDPKTPEIEGPEKPEHRKPRLSASGEPLFRADGRPLFQREGKPAKEDMAALLSEARSGQHTDAGRLALFELLESLIEKVF